MGYRPDLTYRLEVHIPYPFWLPEFMDESELKAALDAFAFQLADEHPVITVLNVKDNMMDVEPLMKFYELNDDILWDFVQAARAMWEDGATKYERAISAAREKHEQVLAEAEALRG